MENNNIEKRVSIAKASIVTDYILYGGTYKSLAINPMRINREYKWAEWWSQFVSPANTEHPTMVWPDDRLEVKKRVNKEFVARNLSNRLFILHHGRSVYMLDGDDGVAAKFFLNRAKKTGANIDTTIKSIRDLAEANGISSEDRRMLLNASNVIDGHQNTLIGAIGRMRSLPGPIKREAMSHLGANTDDKD